MRMPGQARSILLTIVIVALVVSTAYLAAGALYGFMVAEDEGPAATVSFVEISTGGLGGASENDPLPAEWSSVGEYDLGVQVIGLRSESGVVVKFSLNRPGISVDDVDVFYFDIISDSWRSLSMEDKGDRLVATLGLTGGIAMYEGYDFVHRLIIHSDIDGACTAKAWVETR